MAIVLASKNGSNFLGDGDKTGKLQHLRGGFFKLTSAKKFDVGKRDMRAE
ncbi:hypothetical protein WKW50_10795 [Ochrobactrum sp. GPK 3]